MTERISLAGFCDFVSFVIKNQDKIEEFLDGEVFKYSKSVLTE